ncbi:MAG: PEGA domain-containing protein, partial [Vicinamibacterales bacterium]
MGPVFRGEDPATRRAVVVKVLRMGLSPERVAIVAAALAAARERLPRHPALCEMVDSGVQDAEPFVVSAFVEGDSLDVALREYGPANIVDALPRLRLLADALDSAAAVGVTHGGLHLRDILVSPEHTVLTGIGVAPILERVGVRAPVRRPYAAPEVVEGLGVGPAADQFALVAIAHEWLSGRRVSGPGAEGFHIRATTPAGTEAVAAVFCRGLDEQPEARYPTATSWVEALAEVGDALAPRTRLSKRRAPAAEAPRLAFDLGDDDNASEGASGGALGASGDDDGVVLGPPGRDDEATDHAGGITLALDAGDDAGRSGAMDESRPDDDEPRLHIDLALGSAPVASADAGQAEHDEAPEAEAPDVADHPMADVLAAADPDADVHRGGAVRLDADPDDVLSGAMEHPAVPVVTGSLRPPVVAVAEDEAPEERATALPASPAAWAVALVVLAGVAVGVGALLARWGTPSAPAPDTTSMEASAPVADVTTPAAPAATAAAPRAAAAATSPAVVAAAPAAASPAGAADSSRTAASDTALQPAAESARGATARPRPAASARSAAASLPGRLLVRSSPTGAEVFVNGQRRGVTPLAVRDLARGAYAVRLSRPGFDAA